MFFYFQVPEVLDKVPIIGTTKVDVEGKRKPLKGNFVSKKLHLTGHDLLLEPKHTICFQSEPMLFVNVWCL